jgi:putative hemolysin
MRTALLPRELLNKRNKSVEIRIGSLIPFRNLEAFDNDADMTAYLRQRTFILSHREDGQINTESHAISRSVTERVKLEPVVQPQEPLMLINEVRSLPSEQILVRNSEYTVFRADSDQIPCIMQEIGRLREISFRGVGEGTGKAIDLDEFDHHYVHLCLWNEKHSELVGAYRFGRTDEILRQRGKAGLYTSTLFDYSESFLVQLGPALEMGRSFVRPEYQRLISPLFLLWRGIGEYVARNPQYRTLFGPVSISNDYRPISRQLMVEYLREQNRIQDFAGEVNAKNPYKVKAVKGLDLKAMAVCRGIDNLSAIIAEIEKDNKSVPVLLKQYLNLGGKIIGFNVDPNFSDSLDGLIMVDLTQTSRRLLERYLGEDGAARLLAHHSPLCSTMLS